MKNIKLLINLFFLSTFILSFSSLTSNSSYQDSDTMMNNDCPPLGVNIFDEDDEREVYTEYGFSRGDVATLYTADYEPSTEEMVNGKIAKVFRVRFPDNDCYTIAVISTESGPLLVNLGPVWYADEQEMVIQEGDTIGVKGSKLRSNGRSVMIVSQMKTNNKTIKLKNSNGKNEWGTPQSQSWGPSMKKNGTNGNGNGERNDGHYQNGNNGWQSPSQNGNGWQSPNQNREKPSKSGKSNSSSSNQWGLNRPSPTTSKETN